MITQLNVGVSFESKRENYGINNFFEAKEIIVLFTWFFIFKETMLNIYKIVDYICQIELQDACTVTELKKNKKWNNWF